MHSWSQVSLSNPRTFAKQFNGNSVLAESAKAAAEAPTTGSPQTFPASTPLANDDDFNTSSIPPPSVCAGLKSIPQLTASAVANSSNLSASGNGGTWVAAPRPDDVPRLVFATQVSTAKRAWADSSSPCIRHVLTAELSFMRSRAPSSAWLSPSTLDEAVKNRTYTC